MSKEAINRLQNVTPKPTDAEVLAQMFDSATIGDDGTLRGRLKTILRATESSVVPGLQTGITFHDTGFRKDFKDPWPHSDNQVGHFLTAVGLSFNPDKVAESFMGRRLRDWIGADDTMTNEEVALRLTVGHEKDADPGPATAAGGAVVGGVAGAVGGGLLAGKWGAIGGGAAGAGLGAAGAVLLGFRDQFNACTTGDVQNFNDGVNSLGVGGKLNGTAALAKLKGVKVDSTVRGNSYEDLLLSAYGWWLGQEIKSGRMSSKPDAATWVRDNLAAAPAKP